MLKLAAIGLEARLDNGNRFRAIYGELRGLHDALVRGDG
jgi:hypothetical protein